ncbi:MAG: hypothetical protein JXB06_05775 [Spirochaetales bacterium]|nr:hypothetical protein [Spirochaetales bacterium]
MITALLFASCAPKELEELSREELFSLQIGKMDNQIDLFQIGGVTAGAKNRIHMRDGLFYIANGSSAKIMELSSYGDLIFLLYNPEENPPPTSFATEQPDDVAATRRAVAYPLRRVGELVVDSRKYIHVEDVVSEERQVHDKELKVLLDRVILRFDRHGELLDFIGQEGVGGTPFPYVHHLYITDLDNLVVICRTPQYWHVYWYSPEGVLLYQVDIDQEHLPLADGESVPTLGRIVPDRSDPLLHLMIYAYRPSAAEEQTGSYATRIYTLSLLSGRYEGSIEVPHNGVRVEKIGTREVEVPAPSFELLGVNSKGAFFLLRREEANLFQLLILDRQGQEVARRSMVMEDSELFYKEVRLSAGGIIYALLGEEYRATVVWWRSDRLLREGEREGS